MTTQISLRAARVNADMTLQDASKAVGVNEKTLRSWESGKTAMPSHMFIKLCDIYYIDSYSVRIPEVEK